jgi:hypothetical protein
MVKITFKDLNLWLKVAIILAWITGIFFTIEFIVGFLSAIIGY